MMGKLRANVGMGPDYLGRQWDGNNRDMADGGNENSRDWEDRWNGSHRRERVDRGDGKSQEREHYTDRGMEKVGNEH